MLAKSMLLTCFMYRNFIVWLKISQEPGVLKISATTSTFTKRNVIRCLIAKGFLPVIDCIVHNAGTGLSHR